MTCGSRRDAERCVRLRSRRRSRPTSTQLRHPQTVEPQDRMRAQHDGGRDVRRLCRCVPAGPQGRFRWHILNDSRKVRSKPCAENPDSWRSRSFDCSVSIISWRCRKLGSYSDPICAYDSDDGAGATTRKEARRPRTTRTIVRLHPPRPVDELPALRAAMRMRTELDTRAERADVLANFVASLDPEDESVLRKLLSEGSARNSDHRT